MPVGLWCVRADGGIYAPHFIAGSYAGIGWNELKRDLSTIESIEGLKLDYRPAYPDESSNGVVGIQTGQIWRFVYETQAGDFVVTPAVERR